MKHEIYLDNAASTKPYEEVIERISDVFRYSYGNSSSVHKKGLDASKIVKSASETFANILNCEPNEIIFTSGGSESNNTAVKGVFDANKGSGKHVITTPYEHPTLLNAIKCLESKGGSYDLLPFNDVKAIDIEKLKDLVNDKTILVSLMHVNSETGAIIDIDKASSIVKSINENTKFHTDSVQGFGKLSLDMQKLQYVDLLSLSGHKIKGPKGVGVLFVRRNTNIKCLIDGGSHQYGLRAGTLNTPGIAGLEMAAIITNKHLKVNYAKVEKLKEYAINMLKENIDDFIVNSPGNGSPYVLNIAIKGIGSEVLLNHLSSKGIYVSAGSACSSKKKHSHVLEAMKINSDYLSGALRISLNQDNTEEDVDIFVKEVKEVLPMLRMFRRK